MKTEKEWAEFGKMIYDNAINHFIETPTQSIIIPISNESDGSLCRVTFDSPAVFVESYWKKDGTRGFRQAYKKSDGTLTKWKY